MISTAAASSTATTAAGQGRPRATAGLEHMPPEWRRRWRRRARRIRRLRAAFAIAPKTAMPSALPIERPNTNVPVTTPRRSHSTEDCAAISVGLATSPMPSADHEAGRGHLPNRAVRDSKVSSPEPMTRTARADQRGTAEADSQVDAAGYRRGQRPTEGQGCEREASDQRAGVQARPGRTAG